MPYSNYFFQIIIQKSWSQAAETAKTIQHGCCASTVFNPSSALTYETLNYMKGYPTLAPVKQPTQKPSFKPSFKPTAKPSFKPSATPVAAPGTLAYDIPFISIL